jgi:hypothetical protein
METTGTPEALIQLFTYVASGGAGWIASWLFDQLRATTPMPTTAAWHAAGPLRRAYWSALYNRRAAHVVNAALAAAIGFVAAALASWLSGADLIDAIDSAAAAFILAPLLSYMRHRHTNLPNETQVKED